MKVSEQEKKEGGWEGTLGRGRCGVKVLRTGRRLFSDVAGESSESLDWSPEMKNTKDSVHWHGLVTPLGLKSTFMNYLKGRTITQRNLR